VPNHEKTGKSGQLYLAYPFFRWKSWWTRIGWSLVLVGSFCVIIALGHLYLALLVLLIEHLCFYEIMNIAFKINKAVEEQMKEDGATSSAIPLFRTISMCVVFWS
jgi:CDP-diglyceride synthetase